MRPALIEAVTGYVETHIAQFHLKRLETVQQKKLGEILARKNPYLFKAKYTQDAQQLVRGIMEAFISSQEETLFGDFLEGLAVFVCQQVYGGVKPNQDDLTGIDLVFEVNNTLYIVEIKSGPHWGNSSQITKMIINFYDAIERLKSTHPNKRIIPINGCMYGKDRLPRKIGKIKQGGRIVHEIPYLKLCGQDFWHFISNSHTLYIDIIEPLGHQAKERNEQFANEYNKLINAYARDFLNTYCDESGEIQWDRLVKFVSQNDANTSNEYTPDSL